MNILELSCRIKSDIFKFIKIFEKSEKCKSCIKREEEISIGYEQQLIKLEQDIRQHIKTEFQLKIYSESLEVKIDQLEREIKLKEEMINESEFKLKDYNSQLSECRRKLKNFSTINNFNISNNNTINYNNNLSQSHNIPSQIIPIFNINNTNCNLNPNSFKVKTAENNRFKHIKSNSNIELFKCKNFI